MGITRNSDQSLSTEWYAKPIASGRMLNYWSFHPTTMKVNVAMNLIHRVNRLTNNQTLQQRKQVVFNILRMNDYPTKLINRLTNRMITSQPNIQESIDRTATAGSPPQNTPSTSTANNIVHEPPAVTSLYRSLPYVPVLSPQISRILKKEFPNVKIASRSINTTAKIIGNNKDPVETTLQSNVIYRVPCNECQMVYIGMTRNYLRQRMYGHQTDINKYNTMIANGNNDTQQQMDIIGGHTALIEHIVKNKHMFDLSRVEIIDKTFKTGNLPILEMCHITNTANTVNRRTDVSDLSVIYAGILHTYKTRRKIRTVENDNTDNTNTNEGQLVE